jgi:hypothetical protein
MPSSRTSGEAAPIRDPGTPADVMVLDPGSKLRFARDDGAFQVKISLRDREAG